MHDLYVLGGQCDYCASKVLEIFLEEYVYGYFSVAFPPPCLAQTQELHFVSWQHDPAVVVERSYLIVLILYYAHVFQIALAYQR